MKLYSLGKATLKALKKIKVINSKNIYAMKSSAKQLKGEIYNVIKKYAVIDRFLC